MSYRPNSLKWGYTGDYIGVTKGLGSKLLKRGSIGDYIGNYYKGVFRGILGV